MLVGAPAVRQLGFDVVPRAAFILLRRLEAVAVRAAPDVVVGRDRRVRPGPVIVPPVELLVLPVQTLVRIAHSLPPAPLNATRDLPAVCAHLGRRNAQPCRWSFTRPIACMNAYIVVGPTNVQPRFRKSFESAIDSGVVAIVFSRSQVSRRGRDRPSGSYRHTYSESDANSSARSRQRFALLIVLSILPRCRTMPASPRRRVTSRPEKRATRSGSKPANARRKFSRLRRIVSQLRPLWKPSRQIFSKSARSSCTGLPHSASWYST